MLQRAKLVRGKGSVERQKDIVHRGVQDGREDIFVGGSKILMNKLVDAVEVSPDGSSEASWG